MTFIGRTTGLCGLLAVLGLASGCSDYTYFNVRLLADQQSDRAIGYDELERGDRCTIAVKSGEDQIESSTPVVDVTTPSNHPCSKSAIDEAPTVHVDNGSQKNLGVFNYSTARDSGKLKFIVTMKSGNSDEPPVAQGVAETTVSEGKIIPVDLILYSCKTGKNESGDPVFACPITDLK